MNENYNTDRQSIPADLATGAAISRGRAIIGGQGQAHNTASPVRPTPVTTQFADNLDRSNNRAAHLLNRLDELANKLFSELPAPEIKGRPTTLGGAGAVDVLAERLDNLDNLLFRLEDVAERLERIAWELL